MSNQNPILPVDGVNRDDASVTDADVTREMDGERVIDPEANDDLIDSAKADRLAARDPEER